MKLTELNAVTRHYQQKKPTSVDVSGPKKSEYVFSREQQGKIDSRIAKSMAEIAARWADFGPIKFNGKNLYDISDDGQRFNLEYWARYSGHQITSFNSAEEFISSSSYTPDSPEDLRKFKQAFPALKRDIARVNKLNQIQQSYPTDAIKKAATMRGVDSDDYEAALKWIHHYTAKSGRAIPKELFSVIQQITVDKNELPEYVYRGMYYDGAKIKDLDKFLTKWKIGNKPGAKFPKASSWSASIGVASEFMPAQDNVKDQKSGYALLLRKHISDPNEVIADFRNLESGRFWNQQEIILKPGINDYEIVQMLPYEDYVASGKEWNETEIRKFQAKVGAPGSSGHGNSLNDTLYTHFFSLPYLQISSRIKEQWAEFAYMTAAAVKKKGNFNSKFKPEYEGKFENLAFPLYLMSTNFIGGINFTPMEMIDETHIKVGISVMMPTEFGKYKKEKTQLIQFVANVIGKDTWSYDDMGYSSTIALNGILSQDSATAKKIKFSLSDIKLDVEKGREYLDAEGYKKIVDAIENNPTAMKEFLIGVNEQFMRHNANKKNISEITIRY